MSADLMAIVLYRASIARADEFVLRWDSVHGAVSRHPAGIADGLDVESRGHVRCARSAVASAQTPICAVRPGGCCRSESGDRFGLSPEMENSILGLPRRGCAGGLSGSVRPTARCRAVPSPAGNGARRPRGPRSAKWDPTTVSLVALLPTPGDSRRAGQGVRPEW